MIAHPAFIETEFRKAARSFDIPFPLLTVTPADNRKEKRKP
jgi:hypothetical protein